MRWIVSSLVVFAFLGCSGDDDGGSTTTCVPDEACACLGTTTQGRAVCHDDGTQSCTGCPAAPPTGGSGGNTPINTAGTGGATAGTGGMTAGTGGMTAGTGGTGGSGGTTEDDGGVDDDGGSVSAGAQHAACTGDADCDTGLGCYATNHCTLECADDGDCGALSGADYTCGMNGQCRVECADDGDCPSALSCGGNMRCVLP